MTSSEIQKTPKLADTLNPQMSFEEFNNLIQTNITDRDREILGNSADEKILDGCFALALHCIIPEKKLDKFTTDDFKSYYIGTITPESEINHVLKALHRYGLIDFDDLSESPGSLIVPSKTISKCLVNLFIDRINI